MKTTTLDGKTPDIAEENIRKLKQIFPDVFKTITSRYIL